MELFPAQPDLSLQISPPNSKPSSNWIRNNTNHHHQDHHHHNNHNHHQDHHQNSNHEMDLSFWKRALDSRNTNTTTTNNHHNIISSTPHPTLRHLLHGGSSAHLLHSFQPNNHQQQAELNYMRPIRGIPVYQQNPAAASSFPFITTPHHHHQHLDTTTPSPPPPSHLNNNTYNTHSQHQSLIRSRYLSRFPTKRSMRAPRMRWTTTLHARFVHAVELLGGHESKQLFYRRININDYVFNICTNMRF